ncbi:MAG: UDP-glucose:(heptosyl)LPS alpha-1,3-glucosyltransferase [Planctomycetota bacterium]|jgi:UDP-glucose:(heptosyl)LPS alpha-1,3-glucosyltransferase
MRIAMIHLRHAPSGGTERYMNLLSSHLVEAGHQPVIVCRSHAAPHHAGVEFVKLRPFSIGGAARMWNFAVAVEKHVQSANYDLVYNLGKTWTNDVIRLGGGCHASYMELAHEATRTPFERLIRKGVRKHRLALEIESRALAPGAYKQVITNSEMTKRDVMKRHNVPDEMVRVIHNGADTEHFHPRLRDGAGRALRESLGWNMDNEVLLFLGTGYGRKGLDRVLEAAAKLAPSRPAMRLLVAGYDSSRPAWEARAKQLGLAQCTIFLGGRSDPEICYAAADVYALPTRYDPFANSTVEALASGLPTITTPTNGGCELIEEGKNGSTLSHLPNSEDFAQAIAYWFDNRAEGSALARATAVKNEAKGKLEETRTLLEELAKS